MREQSQNLKARLTNELVLTPEAQAIFYSAWYYSGIRQLTGIPRFQTADAISEFLRLPLPVVKRVIEFLVQNSLCRIDEGKITMGPSRTHQGADSPMAVRQHTNWRLKAISNMESPEGSELFYTGPMSLSNTAAVKIRKELVNLLERTTKIAVESESETACCLNIDWFRF